MKLLIDGGAGLPGVYCEPAWRVHNTGDLAVDSMVRNEPALLWRLLR